MPNASRPSDCYPACTTPCTSCGCSECGALVDRKTLRPLTLPSGAVVFACQACLAEDSDGVPVEVPEEAQTVRLPREPIGAAGLGEVLAERGREWAERGKLSAGVA